MSKRYTHLTGFLLDDPETSFFGDDQTMRAKARVSSPETFTKRDGTKGKSPFWMDVTAFGKVGENFARFHSKGSYCILFGKLRMDFWTDKNTGFKRTRHWLEIREFDLPPIGSRKGRGSSSGGTAQRDAALRDETPF